MSSISIAGLIHVGCSTVSPTTSRGLAAAYADVGKTFVAAPVFARPDGLLKRQATWMVAGEEKGRLVAGKLLESSGAVSVSGVYICYCSNNMSMKLRNRICIQRSVYAYFDLEMNETS